jgi:hypothetical protein
MRTLLFDLLRLPPIVLGVFLEVLVGTAARIAARATRGIKRRKIK